MMPDEFSGDASDPKRQTYGQAIAEAVERYCEARYKFHAKAALASEIDELVKFCVGSCPHNAD